MPGGKRKTETARADRYAVLTVDRQYRIIFINVTGIFNNKEMTNTLTIRSR